VSRGPGPHLLAEVSSEAATCPVARALPAYKLSSGAATCSSALDLASLLRWALVLSRGPSFASPIGELRCCHIPRDPQRAVYHRNKERSTCPRNIVGLACVQSTVACYQVACKTCGQTATFQFNSTAHAQLTTPGHGYMGDTTRQNGTTALTMFSIAG
jgi:hypothetical protein